MSRSGNCWDHAVAESVLTSLKNERIKKRIDRPRDIATAEIYDYSEMFSVAPVDTAVLAV
jgi:putative transposase